MYVMTWLHYTQNYVQLWITQMKCVLLLHKQTPGTSCIECPCINYTEAGRDQCSVLSHLKDHDLQTLFAIAECLTN